MNEKLFDVKQVLTVPAPPNNATWQNKTYDFLNPLSTSNRPLLEIGQNIELISFGENLNFQDIINRPLYQIADNTLVVDTKINSIFKLLKQDGFIVGFDLTYQSPTMLKFSRGIYIVNGKYIDFVNYVYKGQYVNFDDAFIVNIPNYLSPNSYYYLLLDDLGDYIFNETPDSGIGSAVLLGKFLTDDNGKFSLDTYVDLRQNIVLGYDLIQTIQQKIDNYFWQNGIKNFVSSLPSSPFEGDRYILTTTNQIIEYRNNQWIYFTPSEGWIVYNIILNKLYKFNGFEWVELKLGGNDVNELFGFREVFVATEGYKNDFQVAYYSSDAFAEVVYLNGLLQTPNYGLYINDYEFILEWESGYIIDESGSGSGYESQKKIKKATLHFNNDLKAGDIVTIIYYQPIGAVTQLTIDLSMKVDKIGIDDIEITDFNRGIILRSPNGTRWRITISNDGNLIATSL